MTETLNRETITTIAQAVSELKYRSMRDTRGRDVKNITNSGLWGKIYYLRSKVEEDPKEMGHLQYPFCRAEWLDFFEVEHLRRRKKLFKVENNELISRVYGVLKQHGLLKKSSNLIEIRNHIPATPAPEQRNKVIETPQPTEGMEECFYIVTGKEDKKKFLTYSSSALYFVGNYQNAAVFNKEEAESIVKTLSSTVSQKSKEAIVLQRAQNNYFIIYDGFPLSLNGNKVDKTGSIEQATAFSSQEAAIDAITAIEILFGFILSKFSIVSDSPNSDKTVTVWPVNKAAQLPQLSLCISA